MDCFKRHRIFTCFDLPYLKVVACLLLAVMVLPCCAQEEVKDENFVVTSLLIAQPGGALYSRVGHAALRMQCAEHQLDYVFSYESEDASHRVLSFLAGNLKMGMFAIPTDEYLSLYEQEGRGVKEYTINLPVETKRNLWRVLDNHVMHGFNLPYDYLVHGCAHSVLMELKESLVFTSIEYGPWPEKFHLTRRELTELQMKDSPWTWCFLNLICNGAIDKQCVEEEKVIMPADLVEVLQHATVNGQPLMDAEPKVLLQDGEGLQRTWFTPLLLALFLLALTLLAVWRKWSFMDYVLLAVQSILGIVSVYLVFFSKLTCTEWSWLLIPFNPLPLIFWKWRKHWSLPYAILIALWVIVMLAWPHTLTDPTYLVLAAALAISYINIGVEKVKLKTISKNESI